MKNFGIGHTNHRSRKSHVGKSKTSKYTQDTQLALLHSFTKQALSHGGELRKKRKGRLARPLSCKEPLHVVFKINKSCLRHHSLRSKSSFKLVQKIIQRYAKKFFIKIEQISIQNDHIHLLVRTSQRSFFHYFLVSSPGKLHRGFRKKEGLIKVATQQKSQKEVTDTPKITEKPSRTMLKLWKHRPFSRDVRGYKAYKIVRNYILLNEKKVLKEISYNKNRLTGLSIADWKILWS